MSSNKTYRRNYYSNNSYRRKNYGLEKALQHIKEAEELSLELGGTDKDVKAYFFSLSGYRLAEILDSYQKVYGIKARQYAEETIPLWRSGRRKMSGMVATRLFRLLPDFMPLESKYDLVKNLWQHYCPKTSKVMIIGPDASEEDVMIEIQSYLEITIDSYMVPEPLNKRFQWLAKGDVTVYQQLLNHFLFSDRDLAIRDAQSRLPVFFQHIREGENYTKSLSRTIELGKHSLQLFFDPTVSGITIKEEVHFRTEGIKSADGDFGWFKWVVGFGILVLLYLLSS